MSLAPQGIHGLAGLLLCHGGLIIPTSVLAAPDLARATATVSAAILRPILLAVNYTNSHGRAQLRVSHADQQVYQLHINQAHHHSTTQAATEHSYPLPAPTITPKPAQNPPERLSVTFYFN